MLSKIKMSILAIEHAVLYFIKYQEPFRAIFSVDFWIINGAVSYRAFGFTALILVIPLFITSNYPIHLRTTKNPRRARSKDTI